MTLSRSILNALFTVGGSVNPGLRKRYPHLVPVLRRRHPAAGWDRTSREAVIPENATVIRLHGSVLISVAYDGI